MSNAWLWLVAGGVLLVALAALAASISSLLLAQGLRDKHQRPEPSRETLAEVADAKARNRRDRIIPEYERRARDATDPGERDRYEGQLAKLRDEADKYEQEAKRHRAPGRPTMP